MKKIIFILFIIGVFYSCQDKVESLLTNYDWEIEKVIDLKTGAINQTEKDNVKLWNFAADNTYQYKTKVENNENHIKGKWLLTNTYLLIHNVLDSTKIHIEKINTEEMVWLVQGKDSLRFYLNSKVKDVVVPDFPHIKNQ